MFPAHGHGVDGVAFSTDGRRLATRSLDLAKRRLTEVKVWHLDRVGAICVRDAHPRNTFYVWPRGALAVAVSPDGGVNLWRPSSLEPLGAIDLSGPVTGLAFSLDRPDPGRRPGRRGSGSDHRLGRRPS